MKSLLIAISFFLTIHAFAQTNDVASELTVPDSNQMSLPVASELIRTCIQQFGSPQVETLDEHDTLEKYSIDSVAFISLFAICLRFKAKALGFRIYRCAKAPMFTYLTTIGQVEKKLLENASKTRECPARQ